VSRLSAIVITRNEAAKIADCLDSLAFCDERIVVDCGSEDDTVRVARDHGARVEHHAFEGFGAQKSFALSLASGEWVLSVDADERVSPALAAEIATAIGEKDADGYEMPRSSSFLGRAMRHSGWYPDYQMRLYRKAASYWDGIAPHETARVRGPAEKLTGELLHYTKRNLTEHQEVLNSYTSLAAEYLHNHGKRVRGPELLFVPLAVFFRTYIVKQGFRDGAPGLIISLFTAYSVFLKYAKVWEKTNVSYPRNNKQ